MSGQDDFDESLGSRTADRPYSGHHPIPTIQRYQEIQGQRREQEEATQPQNEIDDEEEEEDKSRLDKLKDHLHIRRSKPEDEPQQNGGDSFLRSKNRNLEGREPKSEDDPRDVDVQAGNGSKKKDPDDDSKASMQRMQAGMDPKQKRKNMKRMDRDHEGRVVTDPVTHLEVTIHDSSEKELQKSPENLSLPGSDPRSKTGADSHSKTAEEQLRAEHDEMEAGVKGMQQLFPPPQFQSIKEELARTYRRAVIIGMSSMIPLSLLVIFSSLLAGFDTSKSWLSSSVVVTFIALLIALVLGAGVTYAIQGWLGNRVSNIWDDEVWSASRAQEVERVGEIIPESTTWLNSLLSSVWPLINPDLFTSLADTLEDVMQASLPKTVRMVSVDDLGQGNEAFRILGIRWLPTGAAAQSVSKDGKIKSDKGSSDRTVPGEGQVDDNAKSGQDDDSNGKSSKPSDDTKDNDQKGNEDEENIAEGMEKEEGDFVNMEIAFSYRATSSGRKLEHKSKNAHLYLVFYLPGGIRFPIFSELQGIVGTMRVRLQLCPDPPFFDLATITLLGQPKANLSCVPLTRKFVNLMDLPLISSFVQSSIDAALAEYVAPRSLTLDLKNMLLGDDFKKDTHARGMIVIRLKKAYDFKEGDGSIKGLKRGSSDPYLSVAWGKFGKNLWASRVILKEMNPVWDETAFVLVGPEELNAQERLRVQLWDSDRTSADDLLGKVEVDLKDIMHDTRSNGKMWDRKDSLQGFEADEKMPGTLEWSVGYFRKVRIQDKQLQEQKAEPDIQNKQELKNKVSEEAQRKLREASDRDTQEELGQQKAQDLKAKEDELVISAPPMDDYPSGILSIQVHNITGLEFQSLNKDQDEEHADESDEEGEELPSSYCKIILNHVTVFKTRTKPKNSKPFFNAGAERPIRDWRTTEIFVAVRDARVHEDDPLIGIVYLHLGQLFRERSQIVDNFPLVGGIGHGRIRLSLVFRSVQVQVPKELRGWDYGTIEITGAITSNGVPEDLSSLRLKLRSAINHGKMYSSEGGKWSTKKDRQLCIAVRKRYSSCLVVEFRKNSVTLDTTPAFAILWLKDIADDQEETVTLQVWRGQSEDLKRAESNMLETMGEKAGTIDIRLKFHPGLSGFHKSLSSKHQNMKDVMEVLDVASDSREIRDAMPGGYGSDTSDSSNDDNDDNDNDGEDEDGGETKKIEKRAEKEKLEEDGSRGPMAQINDYKQNHKSLHRQHRGLMQWKGARTANWMKTKLEHGKGHIAEKLNLNERGPGMETEV